MTKNLIYLFLAGIVLLISPLALSAQQVDSILLGRDVYNWLAEPGPAGNLMRIYQSDSIVHAMQSKLLSDMTQGSKFNGFRVRIFFDNKQSARAESERIASEFSSVSPGIAVYRIYENPYFKVTVGDFRTKSEATRFMNSIKGIYPQAFITRDQINYPLQ
jgi:hypothetical protein